MKNRFFYILLFLFFGITILKAEKGRLITPNDGLSNSHINQIYQDSKGYIWIATENGLNKFNGYDFEVYLAIPDDTTSIKVNFVTYVFEDSRGLFWVSTLNGLLQFDRTNNIFLQWKMEELGGNYKDSRAGYILEDRNNNLWISFHGEGVVMLDAITLSAVLIQGPNDEIANKTINCMYEDHHGHLWFGTEDHGVFVFNPTNNTIKHFHTDPFDPTSLNSNKIFSICENANGEIWIGTLGGGINIFDEQSQSFKAIKSDGDYTENLIYSLLLDNNQTFWAGTDGAGLFSFDIEGNKSIYWEDVSSIIDLRSLKVHALFQDRQGNIWAGLFQKGVLLISATGRHFQNIGFNPFDDTKSIGTQCVISIIEDYQGNVWAGTDGDGLYRINTSGNVDHFSTHNTPGLRGSVITALFEDKEHNIWIGTYLHGLFRYNIKDAKIDMHFQRSATGNGLNYNHVTSFLQDDDGNIWIATMGGGVSLLDMKTFQFQHYLNVQDSSKDKISGNWVFDIYMDTEKTIWAATSDGLNCYNPEKNLFDPFALTGQVQAKSHLLFSIQEDRKGNIWIGSFHGLHRIDKRSGLSRVITTKNGLPDNMVTGIEEDINNVLWVSTGRGLSRYNPETEEFINFLAEDGIQSNEFRRRSHFKGKNDKMYFGGIKGITTFIPSTISVEYNLLELVFTDLYVNNELVRAGQSDILTNSLDETTTIKLKYNQNNFTFHFAALEYGMPHRVEYFAQMETFDPHPRQVKSNIRSVTYTNMNPGKYVFKVQATIDGVNILHKEMEVIILPPWWMSTVLKIIYGLIVVVLLFFVFNFLSYRKLQQYHKQLEEIVEERTSELISAKEKAEESDMLKSAFLANMSHEIRTPLHGIVGFLKFLNKEDIAPEEKDEYIDIIKSNSIQLQRIIDDIIDVSKIEAKLMTIMPIPIDLNKLMNEMFLFFKSYLLSYKKENIELILDTHGFIDDSLIYADALRLQQVLNNLISNAVKFTEKGYIRFGYRKSEPDMLEFVVEDSGIGIPADQLEVIFERFRQAEFNKLLSRQYGGSGLGLTISRSLVQLKGGELWVQSTEGIGSTFYFNISYLPIAPEELNFFKSKKSKTDITKPIHEKSVLLVEPNQMKSKYYEKLIFAAGANLIKAENFHQCQDILAQLTNINVVFINASIVDTEDIYAYCKTLKERHKFHIVIIMSNKDRKNKHFIFSNISDTILQTPVGYTDILKIISA